MKIFISGGCKNGKSTFAQELACRQRIANSSPLYYAATMEPVDHEDDERIARHIKDREGMGFETIEIPRNITGLITECDISGSFLLDSVTALLSNEMFENGELKADIGDKLGLELTAVMQKLKSIVIVSDYICADSKQYDEWTESYRQALAGLDRVCAAYCDVVIEVCYGFIIFHKGKERFLNEEAFKGLYNGIEYVHNNSASSGLGG